jgi:hypothetical protein
MVCYEKKLTADVSTLALEPLDTSSTGGPPSLQEVSFPVYINYNNRLKKNA